MNTCLYCHKEPLVGIVTDNKEPLAAGIDIGMPQNYLYRWDISGAWKLADRQFEFFSSKGNGDINGDVIVIKSVDEIAPKIQAAKDEGMPIDVGDLMYFVSDGKLHHATIVSEMTDNMIRYAGNTAPRHVQDLDQTLGSESVYIIRMKNSV